MLELGVKLLLAYLLGTVLGSLVLGRMRGVDIRSMGSGNAGATNAMRTQGKWFGLVVLCIDVAKGVIAVRWLPAAQLLPGVKILPAAQLLPAAQWLPAAQLPVSGVDAVALSLSWMTVACGFAAIVGHVFPVWFGFRGGKGFATMIGVIGAVQPFLLLPLLIGWLAVLVLTGFVGLATIVSGFALLAFVTMFESNQTPLLVFCACIAAFIVFTHRSNIVRMRAGEENRLRRLWLFRPRAA